jgi:tetratricopeptide (TPR) repeat protein
MAAAATLLLNEGRISEARAVARRAVEIGPRDPRAALGLGSALLAAGEAKEAIPMLERAAETFGDHPGSWIAAGWAHFLSGDRKVARACFERALTCDDTFAESHGALAVVDIAEGHIEEAKRELEVARRLDRNCFSAALGRAMLLESDGNVEAGEKVRAAAMGTPIDSTGRTLAQAILALRGRPR